MRIPANSAIGRTLFIIVTVVFATGFLVYPQAVSAQTCPTPQSGNNAVYATCSGSITTTGSSAFIDASVFGASGTGTDICQRINAALNPTTYPSVGAVVDARGINGNNSSMNCSMNPWSGIATPSTVLLPTGTITLTSSSSEWVLPGQTKVIGVTTGDGIGTTLKAGTASLLAMIEFCSAACTGVSVENLVLDGHDLLKPGILNQNAGDLSYVDHVTLMNFKGTPVTAGEGAALFVAASLNTQGSGPYSNITCQPSSQGECVDLEASYTHGIHGMTCTCSSGAGCGGLTEPAACIRLNGSGNTIEDFHVEGFTDGIVVGSESGLDVDGDTLVNINGGDGSGSITNVVHICGPNAGTGTACSSQSSVGDLAILGMVAQHDNNSQGYIITNLLADDVTDTKFLANSTTATPVSSGLYTLGNSVTGSGTSFFATSSRNTATSASVATAPAWIAGTTQPPTGNCPVGSLYSNQSNYTGTAQNTLWVCEGTTGSSTTWVLIK